MLFTKDNIIGFSGSWGSGLGTLVLENAQVHCENGQTVRSLDAAFGDVISSGHTVNGNALKGKEIVYSTDFIGVLECFIPYDAWLEAGYPELEPGEEYELESEEE